MPDRTETKNAIIDLEIDVTDATIEQTGDAPDAGPMAMVSAIASTLAEDGDVDTALEMLLGLQRQLHADEIEMLR